MVGPKRIKIESPESELQSRLVPHTPEAICARFWPELAAQEAPRLLHLWASPVAESFRGRPAAASPVPAGESNYSLRSAESGKPASPHCETINNMHFIDITYSEIWQILLDWSRVLD